MRLTPAMAALAACALALPASGQTGAKGDPAKAQLTATQVCAGCHGADGNSPTPTNPNLAGQHAAYITKQLMNFKSADGKAAERASPVMNGMVVALTPDDMKNLGAYFAAQAPKPGTAKDKDLVVLGQKLYRGGDMGRGIPACAGCHSPNGAGIPAQYPRLAGQHADYTVAQLKGFRSGERANDPQKMMRMIAAKMSDREIQALAEYVAGLR
ncbi:MAG: cytochrome c4 [Betaproteobacteria bacterium]|nr:cytochrome c4 [Betaproteobacteria bacterium]